MNNDLPDGIYLDLTFPEYLAINRISSSAITNMMEGPSKFWAESWMNPDKQDTDSEAMKLGRAYHAARLEPETFAELYCRDLVPEDLPEGSLTKDAEYKEALKEMGVAQTKAGETVLDRARRLELLLASGDFGEASKMIWHTARDRWEQEHAGMEWISPKAWGEIKRDAERMRANPELAALIQGGAAEVSILFTDPESGLRCKIRPDYMGPSWITHLKTWDAKSAGKPGNRAIVDAFNYNGYYRAAWFYRVGIHQIADAELKLRSPTGKIMKLTEISAEKASLVASWQKARVWEDWFLFVRRSGIPDIRARKIAFTRLPAGVDVQSIGADTGKFREGSSALAIKAEAEMSACMRQILECMEIYGTDGAPWYPRDMMGVIEDDDFSPYWLESMNDPR